MGTQAVARLVEALCYKPQGRQLSDIFHWHNPSDRKMVMGSTQTVTEMSSTNIFCG
jgi:hypothetical protein